MGAEHHLQAISVEDYFELEKTHPVSAMNTWMATRI